MNDNIIKKPFESQTLEEDRKEIKDIFTVRLSIEERALLDKAKIQIQQPKDSTALKQLAKIGIANVLHDKKTTLLIDVLFKNKRNNKRNNVFEFD